MQVASDYSCNFAVGWARGRGRGCKELYSTCIVFSLVPLIIVHRVIVVTSRSLWFKQVVEKHCKHKLRSLHSISWSYHRHSLRSFLSGQSAMDAWWWELNRALLCYESKILACDSITSSPTQWRLCRGYQSFIYLTITYLIPDLVIWSYPFIHLQHGVTSRQPLIH